MEADRAELTGRAFTGDDLAAVPALAPDGVVAGRATDFVDAERDKLDGGVAAAGRLYRLADLLFRLEDEH